MNFPNKKLLMICCMFLAAGAAVLQAEIYEEKDLLKGLAGINTGAKKAMKARINCVEFEIEKYESETGSYELFKKIKTQLQKDGKKLIKNPEIRQFTYIISEIASTRKDDYGYLCFKEDDGAGRIYIITGGRGKSDLISIPLIENITKMPRGCGGKMKKPEGTENSTFLELVGKNGSGAASAEILEIRGMSREVLESFYENEIERQGWKVSEKHSDENGVLYVIAAKTRLYYLRVSENKNSGFTAVILG